MAQPKASHVIMGLVHRFAAQMVVKQAKTVPHVLPIAGAVTVWAHMAFAEQPNVTHMVVGAGNHNLSIERPA
jgi:hypothetical protein